MAFTANCSVSTLPFVGSARGGRQQSLWRRENHPGRQPISHRGPKDYTNVPPEFRRSLRQWYRNRPIDLSYGYPDTGRPFASCAMVGNSGILLKHEHGELIDGHDIFIRINNARVQGYQRHVRSKTSVSFINSNILHFCARRQRCFCHPYGDFVPIVMYVCQAAHFIDYAVCNNSHKSPLLITDAWFDTLMYVCQAYSAADAKHHYHTNQRVELGLHDYAAEYAFYRDLAERPNTVPYGLRI